MPGSGVVRDTLPLDVSVLGIPRSADVTLPFAILYSSPPGDCPPPSPRRTLCRGARS